MAREAADVVRRLDQLLEAQRGADALAGAPHAEALQREQVALGHDAHQTPCARDGHMADAMRGHGQRRVLRSGVVRQAVHGLHHHRRHRRVQWHLRQGHAAQNV